MISTEPLFVMNVFMRGFKEGACALEQKNSDSRPHFYHFPIT